MRLARKRLIEVTVLAALAGAAGIVWLSSEARWARLNNPLGKFDSSSEYLAAGRLPSRVATMTKGGSNYFIAFSPTDSRLALPSGPAAYVFDSSGRLVSWSRDSGDDGEFQRDWPLVQQQRASIDDLRKLGIQRDSAANRSQPILPGANPTSAAAGSGR
jgi:hypothetical protein